VSKRPLALVVAHHGYRDEELELPRQAFVAAGWPVVVASSSLAPARGMLGGQVEPDRLYSALALDALDGLVFVGGLGAAEYFPDHTAWRLCKDAVRAGKPLGAICYAPSILAEAGLLEGRKATSSPARQAHLAARGARWVDAPSVTDGPIVTGRGPEDAAAFASAFLALLGR
jgi:protease I